MIRPYKLKMTLQNTYLHIPHLLDTAQLQQVDSLLANASFVDGGMTATDAAKRVKRNLQMDMQTQQYAAVHQILLTAINRNLLLRNAVFPKEIYPFLISRYTAGMTYGWHVDSPVMGNMMRTDIAMTIFLNEKEDYSGGELELQTPVGNQLYKYDAGDAICYPCTQLHRVCEVQAGERRVAVTWMESLIKSQEHRQILFELQQIIDSLFAKDIHDNEARLLQQNHSNLIRMWCA
ncbi:Fe2+-dependent dioxygenase [Mucilaginibacter lacusdianchii]|uniref:Fe2+-dependent dioxygenase n=1 Tax=Mucilaginibacter lacusdianchii TaxID=2684211 RepID=UPI00131CC7D8|nr:Fe2+-dependent dioxygenase [Mucilaginibacter sp. JXJ CY 39]